MSDLIDKQACQSERETIALDGLLGNLSRKTESYQAQKDQEDKLIKEKAEQVFNRAKAVVGAQKGKQVQKLSANIEPGVLFFSNFKLFLNILSTALPICFQNRRNTPLEDKEM